LADLRVVTIAPYVPYADMPHAGGAYLYRYLTAIADKVDVTLIAPTPESEHASPPAGVAVHRVIVPQEPRSSLHRRVGNARNFRVGLTPGWQVLRAFRADAAVRDLVSSADVIDIQWGHMLPLIGQWDHLGLRLPPIAALSHDVVSQSFERRANNAGPFRRRLFGSLTRRVAAQEAHWLNRCGRVRVFSDKDRALLQSLGVLTPIDVIDPDLTEPPVVPPAGRSGPVAFVGALWRPENVDGVAWFCREIWPRVLAQLPSARLVVTGANPPRELEALTAAPSIEVHGFVPDLGPAYAEAAVFVVPLRMGAGLKFKVPQAMLYNLPVVTTTVGAEGIVEETGEGLFGAVTDDPRQFAAAVVRCLTDRPLATKLATEGRSWASEKFSFDHSVDLQIQTLERLAAERRSATV